MKINHKQVFFFYLTAVLLLTIYTLTSIKECEAYWMHDASIAITKRKVLTDISCIFLVPIIIIPVQAFFKIKTQTKLFLTHFFISLTAILLLVFAINKPCADINGGHYMFINAAMTAGYYLFKSVSFIIAGIIIIQTILLKSKITKPAK